MSDSDQRVHLQIVGAGPAGLSAALAARALGAEVVVYEKRHDVGARFHGDFQGLENWSQGRDVLAELEQHGIGADFVHTPVYESYLLVNDGCGTVATCLFRDFHRERHYLERTVEFFREHAGLRWRTARRFGGSGNYGRVQGAAIGARLYAGEAAGFQDALFGFGLRYALISGHLAGRAHARGRPSDFGQAWRARLASFNAAGVANRWLYARLGDTGRRMILVRGVAGRDPRRVLNRLYRPARWKSAFARLIPSASLVEHERVSAECDCTWCRCQREHGSARVTG
jgi:flavin-dependent dehydrogenase